MAPAARTGWDGLALVAGLLGATAGGGYLWLIGRQGNDPVVWFPTALVVGVLLAVYGAATAAPARTAALAVSGTVLVVLGLVGIFSVGLPVLAAGVLVLTAGARSRRRVRP
ncbi:hypothetical protein ACFFSW_01530 [Saccharothrix longispora]|uniref:Uncharacterized protein n=1 Tax=Saccharothrix longispora TaxID=33920 RepID=A0ABU1PVJ5_9PSEU|nr:hypothetical protein [Saccharothrix longispora]MDR6594663.1 hypothetical protein [Saccharothrix longispora]